ncbi:MAG: putative lipid II flippase FtsW [Candidatus Omnitrophica bacterium]|nr:putative lipid II flippase FtsW [Candidatus Omnitrophota bacterium]
MRSSRRGLLVVTALLVAVGVVMVYSTSAVYCQERYGDAAYFLKRHLVTLLVGLLLGAWVLTLDPQAIRKWVKPIMGISLLSLLLVLVPGLGYRVSGARRWFRIGWFSLQPSELAQPAAVLYMADLISRKRGQLESFFQGVLPILMVLGAAIVLILAEPDLGTALALGGVALLLLFIAGVKRKVLLTMLLASLPAVAALVALKPYRVRRILAYLNPWADPEGSGFQLIQSLVALGSGGLLGVGLGDSRQKLFYLPAAHTDFIFSVLGEELGLLGTTAVLLLLGLLVWYAIRVSLQASDPFAVFSGLGFSFLLALEGLVHVGVTSGAVPTKGLPFPFVSYGGTSLVMNLVMVAVLLNLSRLSKEL